MALHRPGDSSHRSNGRKSVKKAVKKAAKRAGSRLGRTITASFEKALAARRKKARSRRGG